jgi:hypothetical protein
VPGDPAKPAQSKAEEVMRPTWKGDWFGKGGGDNLFLASIVAIKADTGEWE